MWYTPHKWIFTHMGLSAHAHNIVQEVEVHGWLLSGIEEDYTLLLFFDSCSQQISSALVQGYKVE